MSNSIVGKEFTYKDHELVILDEAKIRGIDNWKLYVTISTNIYDLTFSIIDFNTYFNYDSMGPLTESRAKELLYRIFDDLNRIKCFRGYLDNNIYDDTSRYEISLLTEDLNE